MTLEQVLIPILTGVTGVALGLAGGRAARLRRRLAASLLGAGAVLIFVGIVRFVEPVSAVRFDVATYLLGAGFAYLIAKSSKSRSPEPTENPSSA